MTSLDRIRARIGPLHLIKPKRGVAMTKKQEVTAMPTAVPTPATLTFTEYYEAEYDRLREQADHDFKQHNEEHAPEEEKDQ